MVYAILKSTIFLNCIHQFLALDKNMVPVIGGAFGGVLAALAIVALVVVWRKQLL